MNNNPFGMLMNMMSGQGGFPGMGGQGGFPGMPTNQPKQNQQMNTEQFKQMLPNINENMIQQLVQQAQTQGIPQADIDKGLNFLKQLTNK